MNAFFPLKIQCWCQWHSPDCRCRGGTWIWSANKKAGKDYQGITFRGRGEVQEEESKLKKKGYQEKCLISWLVFLDLSSAQQSKIPLWTYLCVCLICSFQMAHCCQTIALQTTAPYSSYKVKIVSLNRSWVSVPATATAEATAAENSSRLS